MATALPTNPDLECSICLESCKTQKILSCGHSFCRDCLVRNIDGKNWTFPCPLCKQDVEIQRGDVNKLVTIFIQTSTDSPKTTDISTSLQQKHYCPNHKKKEVDYYCQTCNLGLCFKCIFNDHNDHKTLDLELDSTRKQIVQELSKYELFLKNKIKDLEKTHAALLETSEKLKSFCDEACTKISEKTENIIGELIENCKKIQNEFQDTFDKNESKLTETRQNVMTQIENIKTDLDKSRPTSEKPILTLIYSLNKLQDLQKLCENMKTDIPPVTYVEWREGSVKVCDILGSTLTKPLYQSSKGSISTVAKLYQYIKGNVFKFNYTDIKRNEELDDELDYYYSKNKYRTRGLVWSCKVDKKGFNDRLDIFIELLEEDNKRVFYCEIEYTLTLLNKDKDKNVSETETDSFYPGISGGDIDIPWDKLTDPLEGFIDIEGQFLVRFDILKVLDVEYDNDKVTII